MVVGVGGGIRGVGAGRWTAGGMGAAGWDEDRAMPGGASAPFTSSEIGKSFPPDAGGSTMVVWVSGGCDADGVMPAGASAPFTFSEIG